jgi:hypothetical protein
MKTFYLIGVLMLCVITAFAQKRIDFREPGPARGVDLKVKFKHHELFKADVGSIYDQLEKSNDERFQLNFSDKHAWDVELKRNDLIAHNYTEIVGGEGGKKRVKVSSVRSYSGVLKGGRGHIAVTVDHGFFSAALTEDGQTWYIEQAQYMNGEEDTDMVVVYNANDVIATEGAMCGVEDTEMKVSEFKETNSAARIAANGCKVVELAIASDYSMFTKYGNASAVFSRNIAIMNNVSVLYRHEFADNVEFRIVAQYVAEEASGDPLLPLTAAVDPSTVLWNFTAWAEAGNFNVSYGLGQLWTNRDFTGSTIGIAWVRAVCTAGKYSAVQDFGGSIASMAVLAAHEIGHNFGASHDAGGSKTIMAPSVNSTTTWSDASKSDINYQLSIRTCFKACSAPVTPDFTIFPSAACVGGSVLFKDKSANSESRSWEFPSGSLATSSLAQVSVSYALPGVYDVTLTPNNSDEFFSPGRIVVSDVALNEALCPLPSGTAGSGGIKNFTLNEINFGSGSAATDGSKYVNRSCSINTGLKVNTSYDLALNVGQASAKEYISIYIDYNGDGRFNETNERIVATQNTWSGHITYNNGANAWLRFTTPAQVKSYKVLRLRVISDTSKPGSACHNPVNGQVEDYGVVFRGVNLTISLPVDLISFTAKNTEGSNLLQWRTVNESDMKSYIVQRSDDAINFSDIGLVAANNSGKDKSSYEFRDEYTTNKSPGYYYKLKMEGSDGEDTFSRIVYLKNNEFQSGLMLASCQTLIDGNDIAYDLVSNKSRSVTVTVFDMMGNKLDSWKRQLHEGKNQIKDDVSRLNSGMMFFSVSAQDHPVIVQKILK